MNYKRSLAASLMLLGVLSIPCVAKADVDYTFIKMNCDVSAKQASIKVFVKYNDKGEAEIQNMDKNMVYINDVPAIGKTLECTLNDNQTVSFVIRHSPDHSGNDNVSIISKNMELGRIIPLEEREVNIRLLGQDDFLVRDCSLASQGSVKQNCKKSHVVDGSIVPIEPKH